MRRGFSLLEIVIVLALIALVGSLIVVNAEGMLRGLGKQPIDRIFQKAVREARYQAASLKEPVLLIYQKDKGNLQVIDDNGEVLADFDIATEGIKELPELEFEQILPDQGMEGSFSVETYPIKQVVFRPDRSSTPFQVTIRVQEDDFTLRYDPFSAIVINDSRNP